MLQYNSKLLLSKNRLNKTEKRSVIVGFFDFFKRKKKVKERKAETNNTNDSESIIKIKQKLFAKNGDIVTICDINEKTITVEYKHKKYKRDKSVIGKTLFVSKPLKSSLITQETQIDDQDSQEKLKLKQEQEIERIRLERAEIYRKQEEERKFQKQLEQQRKEEERQRQEKLELYRKQEERKRQAQLSLRRKKDAERRVQEKIELEKKKKEGQSKQEQLLLKKINKNKLSIEFKKNETPIYHDIYGDGVFVKFDSTNKFIHVKFNSKEKTTVFSYPDSIGKYLFMKKTEKLLKKQKFLKNSKNEQEYLEEQQYFIRVCEVVDKKLKSANQKERFMKYGYNDFSDSYDSSIYQKHQNSIKRLNLLRQIRKNPYFARIDYGKNLKFYIGKNPINNLVIDWRDKMCNLYYQYNIYIGNEEKNLSLVRDFDIISGIYCGFNDKYSRKNDYRFRDAEDKVISDGFLIKVISESRADKKTHDIIQTIQRNQYEIITYDKFQNMIVLGCAGSGKTMIMLHRLSYMIFNNQDININNIYIISPTHMLNIENDELSQMLNINSVNRMEARIFNTNLIRQYYNPMW